MEGSPVLDDRGVILTLRFEATAAEAPRPENLAAVLDEIEGLYRSAPAAAALGVPIAELLSQYHVTRAEAMAARSIDPRDWWRLLRPGPPELEEALYLTTRLWRTTFTRRYGEITPPVPGNAIRVRRLTFGSPFDFVAHIPADYWKGGGFMLFLAALERRFNMVGRIRTERVNLRAKRAERRADEREAELREERAARELEGLRQDDESFRLVAGEVAPDHADAELFPGDAGEA